MMYCNHTWSLKCVTSIFFLFTYENRKPTLGNIHNHDWETLQILDAQNYMLTTQNIL